MPSEPASGTTAEARLRLLALFGWATGAAFFFYAWVLRVAPSVMIEELMRDLSVNATVLGNLSAAYFFGYAGMQIPVGMMLDRFGPRRLMTIAALVCASGCVMFALGQSLAMVTAGRFLIGASAAFSLVGSLAIAARWFPQSQFALFAGLAMAAGMAGGVMGQAPLRVAVEATDWRTTSLVLALGGLVLAVSAFAFVRDKDRGSGGLGDVFRGLAKVARDGPSWLIALAGLGANGVLLGFASLWGVPFLETAYGASRTEAASTASLLIAGWGIGAPIMGWACGRVGERRLFLWGLTCELIMLSALILVPGLPYVVVAGLCFLIGIAGSTQIAAFGLIRARHGAHLSGTAIGFLNGMMTGAGAVFQPLIGLLLDLQWSGEMVAGTRVYTPEAYRLALSSLVVFCGIGLLCMIRLRRASQRAQTGD